jgi:hypothetical protein
VVDHRPEFMRGDPGRQPAQRSLDVTAFSHIAAPSNASRIISDLVGIIV